MKIIQISCGSWGRYTLDGGDQNIAVFGLGDDNNIYEWNKEEGKWELSSV